MSYEGESARNRRCFWSLHGSETTTVLRVSCCFPSISGSAERFKDHFSEWTLCWLHLRFLTRVHLFAGIGLWKQWPASDVTNRLQYFLDNAQKRLVYPTCSQSILAPAGSLLSVWSRSWTSEDMMLDLRSSSRGWTRNEEWKWGAGGRGGDAGGPFTASFSHHQHTSVYRRLSFISIAQLTVFTCKCVTMHQARAFIVGKWALTGLDACDVQVNERVLRVVWLSAASDAAGSILSPDAALRIKRDLRQIRVALNHQNLLAENVPLRSMCNALGSTMVHDQKTWYRLRARTKRCYFLYYSPNPWFYYGTVPKKHSIMVLWYTSWWSMIIIFMFNDPLHMLVCPKTLYQSAYSTSQNIWK